MNHWVRCAAILLATGCSSRPIGGGACSTQQGLIVSVPARATNAALVGGNVYFDSLAEDASIYDVPIQGGAIETLVSGGATGEWAAGGGVFAWETDRLHIRDAAGVVHDLPENQGGVVGMIADDSGNVYWKPVMSRDPGIVRWDHTTQMQSFLAGVGYPSAVDDAQI